MQQQRYEMNSSFGGAMTSILAALVVSGCVSTTPGARPDDMSAEDHRRAASNEERVAQEHADRYDPSATVYRSGPAHGPEGNYSDTEYNPTNRHLSHARTHTRHASDHQAAAEALEAFEEGECAAFSSTTRAACPLLGQLESVEDIEGGVRLRFLEEINFQAVSDHVRCHLAFGRTRGYEGMTNCPLYLRGLQVRPVTESRSLELTTDDPEVVTELRRRAATHVEADAE